MVDLCRVVIGGGFADCWNLTGALVRGMTLVCFVRSTGCIGVIPLDTMIRGGMRTSIRHSSTVGDKEFNCRCLARLLRVVGSVGFETMHEGMGRFGERQVGILNWIFLASSLSTTISHLKGLFSC